MRNVILSLIISLLILPGCGSMKNMSREDRAGFGAQIGSFVGWLFGGLIGEVINDERGGEIGSFIGTAVGGVAGASIAASTDDEIRTEQRRPGKYTASSHSLLPDLHIEDILLVEDSITCNQKIDAGETCHISFVIVNNSFQDALDVIPIVKVEKGEHLELSDPVKIPRVSYDDSVTYEVTVYASPELQTGEAIFSVRLEEGRGNGTETETFTASCSGSSETVL
ncbi:glycine zipper family protein [uncultured Parabacteroides sp.]|jgi:hypothetical protein|uniref:glycine zipper family protein n=1 Tax=uncultured Parabacteroides sp. TaxID=512312 RepID=UPI0025CD9E2B|nr:glycine zipper family protein [uncultured Parabacteroides sp.]